MLKEEEAKEIKEAERTDSWLRKKKKKTIYKTPQIGSDEHPFDENTGKILAPDRGPKGDSILKDGKWVPIEEAKHGKLIKGFPKLTKKRLEVMADKYEPYEKPSAVPGIAITGGGNRGSCLFGQKKNSRSQRF